MLKETRKVTGHIQGLPTEVSPGVAEQYLTVPEIGAEVNDVRVRFRYKGKEYETKAFDEFADGTEPATK